MKYASKIKLTGDDFVLVGMNYNYYMIPRLAYPKDNLVKLKQQIFKSQEIVEELRAIWDKGADDMIADEVVGVMGKHFGKKSE